MVKKNEIIRDITDVQHTKFWKLILLYRRVVSQLIKGDSLEKKDFFKWGLNKVLKTKYQTKKIKQFDVLENIKLDLANLKISKTESNFKTKKNKNILIFAGVAYYDIGGGQRSSQLAKTFNKMGYIVDYIFAYDSVESEIKDIFMPVRKHIHINQYSSEMLLSELTGDPVFIFEIPHKDFQPYLDLAKSIGAKVIYEHIDNWETNLGSLFFNEMTFNAFLCNSDVVVATSKLLKDKLEAYIQCNSISNKSVTYLANAVDTDLFDSMLKLDKPNDLIKGSKTLLYYGSLWGDWFDWEKLKYIAHKDKSISINIIGDYKPIWEKIKDFPQNIHFLGLKKQQELPAYLYHSDIAILPFKNDEIGKYVSPLKIFEYIAMNKVVLSTKLPDVEGYPNVFTSDSKEEWIDFINSYTGEELEEADNFVEANNWYNRCNHLLNSIENLNNELKISLIVLNRNNKKTIFKCLDSLLLYNIRYDYEIIVVDNQSTDGSYELLMDKYKDKLTIIKNSKNGCSCGRNLGVSLSNGDLITFLDSDQWAISERWLDTPLSILKEDKNIGAVGWAAGWFSKSTIAGTITDYLPNRGIYPNALYRTDIGYLGTGGLIITRNIFDLINGFDENYDPTCYEDTDLSLKIRNIGLNLAYCPYINVKHLPHQTTNSGSKEHQKLLDKNGRYFLKKWQEKNPHLLEYYYE